MKNKLIYAILSLLGLTIACSKDKYPDKDLSWWSENKGDDKDDSAKKPESEESEDYDDGMCMYGTPTVTFSVKGRVTDTEGEPIEGIRVNVEYTETFTDTLGTFEFKDIQAFGSGDATLTRQLEFQDVDGQENGSFEDRKIDVTFTRNNDVKSDVWYFGDYKAQDTEVVLQTKENK